MIGRIIGIRTVKTAGSGEWARIAERAEYITEANANTKSEDSKGAVYLLVDCSGSMEGYKISQVRKGILEFACDAIKNGYQVGLIKFDNVATHLCEPKNAVEDINAYLDKIEAKGSTNMEAAINMAREYLDDMKCTRVMVIATDGRPDRTHSALQAGQAAKSEGIEIITIGTNDADPAFLRKLATSAESGNKVPDEQFGKAIASAYLQLPDPRRMIRSNSTSHELGTNQPCSMHCDVTWDWAASPLEVQPTQSAI